MANLTVTHGESIVLNGQEFGNTNSFSISGINDIFERIITGQGTDGTSYSVGDLHTIEYEDGYFDYEEGEEDIEGLNLARFNFNCKIMRNN